MNSVRRSSSPAVNLTWIGVGFAVLAMIVLGAVAALILATRHSVVSQSQPVTAPTRSDEDYRRIREEESKLLGEYQWIDRNAGTARIPIERAMALILERGSFKPAHPHSSQGSK